MCIDFSSHLTILIASEVVSIDLAKHIYSIFAATNIMSAGIICLWFCLYFDFLTHTYVYITGPTDRGSPKIFYWTITSGLEYRD
jgi:hypothetical protein